MTSDHLFETYKAAATPAAREAALNALFARLRPRMVASARAVVRDEEAAEDAAQEALLQLVAGDLESFRGEGSIDAYANRIARNRALNHLAAIKRRAPFIARGTASPEYDPELSRGFEVFRGEASLDEDRHMRAVVTPEPSPVEILIDGEERAALAAGLLDLARRRPRWAKALALASEGVPAHEIAAELGTTRGNVRFILHVARKALKRAIEDRENG